MRNLLVLSAPAAFFCLSLYGLAQTHRTVDARHAGPNSLPTLDAHGFNGVQEISKTELLSLMSKSRPLTQDEVANLNRGCPGLTCVYQGLGLTKWPETAPGTVAYLTRENALRR